MGQRYSKLPSELFIQADTFDLMVMDVAMTYTKYQSDKRSGKTFDTDIFDTETLQEKMDRVKR